MRTSAGPMDRGDRNWLLVLASAAVLLRLALLGTRIVGYEGAHYYLARSLGAIAPNVIASGDPEPLFWLHPLFYVLHHPFALGSLLAARILQGAVAAMLVPAVFAYLRLVGVPLAVAVSGAALALVHPMFWFNSVHLEPGAWAAVLVVGGLCAWRLGRLWLGGASWFVAAGMEASTIFVPLGIFVLETTRNPSRRALSIGQLWAGWSFLLSQVFVWNNYVGEVMRDLRFPPMPNVGVLGFPAVAATSLWLLPLVVIALVGGSWASRLWFMGVAVHLFLAKLVGRWPSEAQLLPLGILAVVAAAEGPGHAARLRYVVALRLGKATAAVLLLQLLVPNAMVPAAFADPLAARPSGWDRLHQEHDPTLKRLLTHLDDAGRPSLQLVDVDWWMIGYPFADHAYTVSFRFTDPGPVNRTEWGHWQRELRSSGQRTLVQETSHGLNEALRQGWDSCLEFHEPPYWLFNATRCPTSPAASDP